MTQPDARTRRWGSILGFSLAGLCVIATAVLSCGLFHPTLHTSDDVIMVALKFVAICALVRLAVILSLAARDVLYMDIAAQYEPVKLATQSHRLAGWLLAAAGLIGSASATASAAPVVHTIAATTHDPFSDLENSGLSVVVHGSDGATSPTSLPGTPTTQLPQPSFINLPQGESSTQSQEQLCVPEPTWTLPAALSPGACRILGGGASIDTPRTHVVQHGETLWGIAASYLPKSASSAQVASQIQAWIKANPALTAHPDLIEVGDILTLPHL